MFGAQNASNRIFHFVIYFPDMLFRWNLGSRKLLGSCFLAQFGTVTLKHGRLSI